MDGLAGRITGIKSALVAQYGGNRHLYEAVPRGQSGLPARDLGALHRFAECNPIYDGSSHMEIDGSACTIYEGDINTYWLDSIKHDASCAPFYPTWILSAYALASEAARLGARQAVDIGSGDGRIAYCCSLAGMRSYGIEIDENLAGLQRGISGRTGVMFDTICADAGAFDYASLPLTKPVFFIGGLPQVGEILADHIVRAVLSIKRLRNTVFVLAGVDPERGAPGPRYGWGALVGRFGLTVRSVLTLPTRWTMDQPGGTPYLFASRRQGRESADATAS